MGLRQILRPFLQRFNARKHLGDRGIVLEIGELPADILDGRSGLFGLLLQFRHHPSRAGQLRNIVPRIRHLRHDLAQVRQTLLEIVGTLQRGRQRTRGLIVGLRQIPRPFLQRFNARKHHADRGIVLEIGELPADILDGRSGLFEWSRDFLHTLRRGCRFLHQSTERLFLALSPLDELAEFFGEHFDLTATKERLEQRCHGSSPNGGQ